MSRIHLEAVSEAWRKDPTCLPELVIWELVALQGATLFGRGHHPYAHTLMNIPTETAAQAGFRSRFVLLCLLVGKELGKLTRTRKRMPSNVYVYPLRLLAHPIQCPNSVLCFLSL